MTTASATSAPSAGRVWWHRLRFVVAVLLGWAVMHYLVGTTILPRGLDRPLVLVASPTSGVMGSLLSAVLLCVVAAVALVILRPCAMRDVLLALGTVLALWAAEGGREGGTIDSWLILQNETPGPPTSGPYWVLLGDYLLLAATLVGVVLIYGKLGRTNAQPARAGSEMKMDGIGATVICALVAAVAIIFLTGPAAGTTLRGQVYFAVGVGTAAGVFVAQRLFPVQQVIWYAIVPLLIGIVGVVVAALNPAIMIPEAYRLRDTIPAWGLVRALPIEMVGVGLVAVGLMFKSDSSHTRTTSA